MSIKRMALNGGRHPASAYYTPRAALLPKMDGRNAMNTQRNIGIAAHTGRYSDAVEVSGNGRWLISAGTPGMSTEGGLPAASSDLMFGPPVTRERVRANRDRTEALFAV